MSRRFGYVVKYFSVLKGELVAVKKRMVNEAQFELWRLEAYERHREHMSFK